VRSESKLFLFSPNDTGLALLLGDKTGSVIDVGLEVAKFPLFLICEAIVGLESVDYLTNFSVRAPL
jgi:hypothetical protein